jgi:hypothetical protein
MAGLKWELFEGDHWDVGRQLGQWWGRTLGETDGFPLTRQYKYWLRKGWIEDYRPLFNNTRKYFPGIFLEICGMARGINDAGFHTTEQDVFSLVLGETGECSSVVVPSENGWLLGHNEEDDRRYPLCFAHVKLAKKDGYTHEFASISHPFQLFGSSAGMTEQFAFQGNSIGYNGKKLNSLWSKTGCVPKTVLSRSLLEAGYQEIKGKGVDG